MEDFEMTIEIHHNPDCGTSRNVLAILEAGGGTPLVIIGPIDPARHLQEPRFWSGRVRSMAKDQPEIPRKLF